MGPKISVVVVTKNSEKHITSCIRSIIKQKYENFDLTVVDATSTDNTVSRIISQSSYIRIYPVHYKTTIGRARQIGLEITTGEIISYIDSDVELPHENWLTNMVRAFGEVLEFSDVAGVQTLAKTSLDDPEILKKVHAKFEYKNRVIDINNYEPVGTSHLLIRRDLIDKVGGFPDISFGEDTAVTTKIMELGYKFIYLSEEKCYHYHVDNYFDYLKKELRNKKYAMKDRLDKLGLGFKKSPKCEFMFKCDLYDPDSPTCNENPGPYCGKYREFADQ